jgi:hypothetical protein
VVQRVASSLGTASGSVVLSTSISPFTVSETVLPASSGGGSGFLYPLHLLPNFGEVKFCRRHLRNFFRWWCGGGGVFCSRWWLVNFHDIRVTSTLSFSKVSILLYAKTKQKQLETELYLPIRDHDTLGYSCVNKAVLAFILISENNIIQC